MSETLSKGQYRVGVTFNPSGDNLVYGLKQLSAELIDLINSVPTGGGSDERTHEVARLKALAMTEVENAAMWAVKAATKPDLS